MFCSSSAVGHKLLTREHFCNARRCTGQSVVRGLNKMGRIARPWIAHRSVPCGCQGKFSVCLSVYAPDALRHTVSLWRTPSAPVAHTQSPCVGHTGGGGGREAVARIFWVPDHKFLSHTYTPDIATPLCGGMTLATAAGGPGGSLVPSLAAGVFHSLSHSWLD